MKASAQNDYFTALTLSVGAAACIAGGSCDTGRESVYQERIA